MFNEADDILSSFHLSSEDKVKYDIVKEKSEGYFEKRRNVICERAKGDKNSASPLTFSSCHFTALLNIVNMAIHTIK